MYSLVSPVISPATVGAVFVLVSLREPLILYPAPSSIEASSYLPMVRSALPLKRSRSVMLASTSVMVPPPVREAMRSDNMSRVTFREMRLPFMESAESSVVTVSIISPEAEEDTEPVAITLSFLSYARMAML